MVAAYRKVIAMVKLPNDGPSLYGVNCNVYCEALVASSGVVA
jgi:hypothetical protein